MASWYFALELGHRYGWEPEGTTRPGADSWKPVGNRGPHRGEFAWYNGYVVGNGRRVSAEDANNLADALERALPDIPDHDAAAHKPRAYPMPAAMARMLHDLPDDDLPDPSQYVNAVEWFSGPRKRVLRDLIAFCRTGGFSVR
jgi:hypothetical protein